MDGASSQRKAGEALPESEEWYRGVVQNTSAVIFRVDPQCVIRFANQRALEFFGYEEGELVGRHAVGTFVPERDTAGRDLAKMAEEIAAHPDRFRTNANENMRKNGERVWVEWTNSGIYDGEGRLTEFLAVGIDATERKRAEEALRESEEKLRRQNALLKSINLVHEKAMKCNSMEELGVACLEIAGALTGTPYGFVGEIGEDGRFFTIAVSLTGRDVFAMDDKAAGSNHKRIGDPNIAGLIKSVFESRRSLLTNNPPSHGTGTGVPRFALSSFLGSPFLSNGKVLGLIGMVNKPGGFAEKDQEALEAITPTVLEVLLHKHAELKRERQDKRLTELSESLTAEVEALKRLHQINAGLFRQENIQSIYNEIMLAAVEITKADCGNIQFFTKDGMLEIGAQKGLSEAFLQFFHHVGDISTTGNLARREKKRVVVEDVQRSPVFIGTPGLQVLTDEGIVSVQSTPFVSSAGNLLGILSTHYKAPHKFTERELRMLDLLTRMTADVVERARAEMALRQSESQALALAAELEKKNKFITDFFINISHEFKTPLTILLLGLDLLETKARKMKEGEAILGNLRAMKQNSYRLNRLVANLLDITKLDAGFMRPMWEEADAAALLRNLAQSVEPYARQRQLSLEYECNPTMIAFTTDGFMLERIALNLLSNAIKHTPAGGQIRISCQASGQGIAITVKDTGEGIPDDKRAIIFDRFSQVDTRMTRASEGTGIGLALTKSLVELLGGKISVESVPGAGSAFTVELPAVREASANGGAGQGNMQIDKRVQMELSDIIIA